MSEDWNISVNKKVKIQQEPEKAILVALIQQGETEELVLEHVEELAFLAETAGAITIARFIQRLYKPETSTFVGKGKLEEIAAFVEANDVDLVIFDDDLTAKQANVIEKEVKRKVLDRSSLILDIFANRAQTAQAKAQVELAQMQYLLPRLRGLWVHLERQRGGIGMRGPGEQEIETDRRIVKDKISFLKRQLEKIDRQNQTQRKNRNEMVRVSLVGYTNVGKSTLMNYLSDADVFAENKLFATLDTTVRKVVFENMPFLLSDTVGFIRKLPHHLVESFKSTLDEVRESDILLHVVDIAHVAYEDHIRAVNQTLRDIGAADKMTVVVFNKMDLYRARYFDDFIDDQTKREIETELHENMKQKYGENVVFISVKDGENLEAFKFILQRLVRQMYETRYPYRAHFW